MYDPGTLYFDQFLTDFSLGYRDQNLYGERIMPVTPVRARSAKYRVFDRSDWVMFDDRREPGTVANEVRGGRWSEDTFNVREHSLQAPIHDEEPETLNALGGLTTADQGAGLDLAPEADAVELITRAILLKHEKLVVDTVRNTANYPGNHVVTNTGAARWDDYTGGTASTSDPVGQIRTAIQRIFLDTGRRPNTMAIPFEAVAAIENHPRIVTRFQNFSLLQPDAFRLLTGFDGQIFVVDSMYNSANNIDATENIVKFWGTDVWIGLVDNTPGQRTKTFGKTFAWPYAQGGIRPSDRWYEIQRKTTVVRTSYRYDVKIASSVAGYIIKTAVNVAT